MVNLNIQRFKRNRFRADNKLHTQVILKKIFLRKKLNALKINPLLLAFNSFIHNAEKWPNTPQDQ